MLPWLAKLLSWDSRGFPLSSVTLHLSLLWRGWELNPGPQALSLEQPPPTPTAFLLFSEAPWCLWNISAVFILMLSFIRDPGPGKGRGQDWGSAADPVCGDPARSMSTVLATVI